MQADGAGGESHSRCCVWATSTITHSTELGQDRAETVGAICLDGLVSSNMGSSRELELHFGKNILKISITIF